MISMIRVTETVKVPVHQMAGPVRLCPWGSSRGALARLELLLGGPITGQDLTDLMVFAPLLIASIVPRRLPATRHSIRVPAYAQGIVCASH